MKNIALVATDLDDTLLRSDCSLSSYTIDTLKAIRERGAQIILASGRTPEAMYRYAEALGLHEEPGYLICNNGSLIIRSDTRETVNEQFIPEDVALAVFDYARDTGLSCHWYENGTIYASRDGFYTQRDRELSGLAVIIQPDFAPLIRRGCSKLLFAGEPAEVAKQAERFQERFAGRATVFISKPYFLEVLPYGAGKGEALRMLAENHLGITPDEIIAFGDSMNDESMLRYAGIGVAMRNAREEIRALADHITAHTNDEDGVARHLEECGKKL